MSARVTTVIFDMFETLVPNDPEQWVEVFQRIIRDQRLNVTDKALWSTWKKHEVAFRELRLNLQDFSKNPPFKPYTEAWSESFDLAFRDLHLRGDTASAVEACLEALRSRVPYPETHEALATLRRRYRLGLVSNADDNYLDGVIARNKFKFEVVLSSEAAKTYKPDPRLFLQAMKLMGVSLAECVYVGDRQFEDVLGARLTGTRCVWINRLDAPLKPDLPLPDATITRLTDLPHAIEAMERAPAV